MVRFSGPAPPASSWARGLDLENDRFLMPADCALVGAIFADALIGNAPCPLRPPAAGWGVLDFGQTLAPAAQRFGAFVSRRRDDEPQ